MKHRRHFFSLLLIPFALNTFDCRAMDADQLYWRVSAGGGEGNNTTLKDNSQRGCNAIAPPALFGCGYHAKGDFTDLKQFDIGLGYRWNPLIRTELLIDYQTMTFKGNANFKHAGNTQPVSADISASSLLINTQVDLLRLFSESAFPIRPFINAGFGLTALQSEAIKFDFPHLALSADTPAVTNTPDGVEFNPVYKLGIGFDWVFKPNMGLQVSYQFYDLGKMKTDEGVAYVYGHGCGVDRSTSPAKAKPLGCNLYVDGIEASVKTQVLSLSFWKTF